MKIASYPELEKQLDRDLKMIASLGLDTVVNDPGRRIFTAKGAGSVLVFPHSQPDAAYWVGVKHYGSGSTSRVRIRRSPAPMPVEGKVVRSPRARRAVKAPADVCAEALTPATASPTLS